MKKLSIIRNLIVLSLVLGVVSCNKKLDVLPQNSITPDQIQTAEDVKALLAGSYSLLQSPNAFGERYLLAADLLADAGQVDFVGTFIDYRDVANKTMITTNTIANGIWMNGYSNINLVNTVLNKIMLITDEDERAIIEGEAKFIRGVVYYYLVNFFAHPYSAGSNQPGVPIMLEPVYEYDSTVHKIPRATVEQVYTQIIADLTEAAAKLSEVSESYRANRLAAQAFLARVYMAQGKYPEAAAAANEVIVSDQYTLTTYPAAFNNVSNSLEDVFAIQQTSQSNAGTNNNGLTTFYAAQLTGRGDAQAVLDYFLDNFEPGDVRGEFGYEGESIGGVPGVYTAKFSDLYRAIPVVRLAEMYLTRGEANYRKGGAPIGGVDPLDDLNEVRLRSDASQLLAISSGDDFVMERFRELAFEGDRVWTLKRLQMNVDGLPFNHDLLIFPIPQREIDVNKLLEQNDGYK